MNKLKTLFKCSIIAVVCLVFLGVLVSVRVRQVDFKFQGRNYEMTVDDEEAYRLLLARKRGMDAVRDNKKHMDALVKEQNAELQRTMLRLYTTTAPVK